MIEKEIEELSDGETTPLSIRISKKMLDVALRSFQKKYAGLKRDKTEAVCYWIARGIVSWEHESGEHKKKEKQNAGMAQRKGEVIDQ